MKKKILKDIQINIRIKNGEEQGSEGAGKGAIEEGKGRSARETDKRRVPGQEEGDSSRVSEEACRAYID